MSNAVFVDTSAWYAALDRDDANHAAAAQHLHRLSERRRPLLTTNLVVGESYTLLRRRLGARAAHAFLRSVRRDPLVRRTFVREAWEEEAERLLEQYDDQPFSYVDATSFVTMRRLGIQDVLTFDQDFTVAGFTPVS